MIDLSQPPQPSPLGKVDPGALRAWAIEHVCVEDATLIGSSVDEEEHLGVPYRPTVTHEIAWRTRAARLERVTRVDLKGRQAGNTTWCLVFAAAAMVALPGLRVLIMCPADKLEEIQGKWRIIRRSIERSPDSGWPGTPRNDNAEFELWANGSRLTWQAAGGTQHTSSRSGISGTPNLVIFSEYAYAPHASLALFSVMPAIQRSGGTVIVDSTPNQESGVGHDYEQIVRLALSGRDPEYELVVLHWWYESGRRASQPAALPLDDDEQSLVERYGLDRFQIQWRRLRIAEMRRRFFRAYVETPDSALAPVESGAWEPMILADLVERRAAGWRPPPLRPEVLFRAMPSSIAHPRLPGQTEEQWERSAIASDLLLRSLWDEHGPEDPRGQGYVRIWATPSDLPPGRCYLGVDPAEGLAHGDAIGGAMLDSDGNLVLTFRLHCDPKIASGVIQRLATWFGAVVAIERSSVWDTIANSIRYALDPDLVARLCAHPILETRFGGAIVFVAQQAKANRVAAYRSWINSGRDIRDPRVLHEMEQHDPATGKARTSRGDDDLLDAIGIAASEHPRLRGGRGRATQGTTGQSRARFVRRRPRGDSWT